MGGPIIIEPRGDQDRPSPADPGFVKKLHARPRAPARVRCSGDARLSGPSDPSGRGVPALPAPPCLVPGGGAGQGPPVPGGGVLGTSGAGLRGRQGAAPHRGPSPRRPRRETPRPGGPRRPLPRLPPRRPPPPAAPPPT